MPNFSKNLRFPAYFVFDEIRKRFNITDPTETKKYQSTLRKNRKARKVSP